MLPLLTMVVVHERMNDIYVKVARGATTTVLHAVSQLRTAIVVVVYQVPTRYLSDLNLRVPCIGETAFTDGSRGH